MLRKFISINNVGRFLKSGASGDVALKRYSLIFAENGRGKTTLCAILRSLRSGDPAYITGRTTLGSADAPSVELLLDAGNVAFSNGQWASTVPELAVFDSTFVSENVHSGDSVDIGHKRRLYSVIVGSQGVDLAKKIEEFDTASRAKASYLREKAFPLQALFPKEMSLETFLALPADETIDAKISDNERQLTAVREAEQIKNRPALSAIALPEFPPGLEELLARSVEGISADAERRVTEQIRAHEMHERGQAWLLEGTGFIRNERCPFCAQSLDGATALIAAYRGYFSEGYSTLRRDIAALRQNIEPALGDRQIAILERTIQQNAASVEFWARYSEIASPVFSGELGETLRSLRHAALALLDRKAAAPLDQIAPGPDYLNAPTALATTQQSALAYNQAVAAANEVIAAKKAATEGADIKTVESELARLRATKKRYEPETAQASEHYQNALQEKKSIDEEKAATRKALDEYTEQVIGTYEHTINRLLEEFHAGFRIAGTSHAYPGGVASSSYQILINETPVELGDGNTPLDKPSFKNTLSSGDKSTLALAFFLAQLEHDPDKANKIVVFDDPFNSQDSFRKECTVQKIRKCGESSAQVIVLSHDLGFLKKIWDRLSHLAAERKCLKLERIDLTNTAIRELDIERETQDDYKASRLALAGYYQFNDGKPRDIVQKIRPVLETYSRNLGGGLITDSDTLGTIIGKLKNAGPSHQLHPLVDSLDVLNGYTNPYHHGPNAATEPINDGELHGFVKRTLEITGGC